MKTKTFPNANALVAGMAKAPKGTVLCHITESPGGEFTAFYTAPLGADKVSLAELILDKAHMLANTTPAAKKSMNYPKIIRPFEVLPLSRLRNALCAVRPFSTWKREDVDAEIREAVRTGSSWWRIIPKEDALTLFRLRAEFVAHSSFDPKTDLAPDPTVCVTCGQPHRLRDEDAGSRREIARKCLRCFEDPPEG